MSQIGKENMESRIDSVAIELGESLIGDGNYFRSHINVIISDKEKYFSPVPTVTKVDDTPTIICHPEGYKEGWLPAFGFLSMLNEYQVRDMYIATGLSWVELSLLGETAKTERNYISEDDNQAFAIHRAMRIATEFSNKKRLIGQAEKLAKVGIKGVVECVKELDNDEITTINKYRYGLGVALDYINLDSSNSELLVNELHHSLRNNIELFKSGLFDFLIRLVDDELSESLTDEAFEKAFPSLQFAAAIPMNVSYINGK
jgi:hypothetical protein